MLIRGDGSVIRRCVHCGNVIGIEVLIRGRWKSIFCTPECREADKTLIRAEKRAYRVEKGLCIHCGSNLRKSRGQMQANAVLV